MENDISEIKSLLLRLLSQQLPPTQQQQQRQPTPQQPTSTKGRVINIGDNFILGKETAKFTIVEFSDYQCPYCGRHSRETLPEIKKQYIDSGVIRYVVIDQPLPMHPEAAKAAEAAHCAKEQDKFWQMHDAMMARQDGLKDLSSYARELKLNTREFENCLKTGKYKDAVNSNIALANELGMTGVPGFIIGSIDASNPRNVTVISEIRGAMPFEAFQREIDAALGNR